MPPVTIIIESARLLAAILPGYAPGPETANTEKNTGQMLQEEHGATVFW